MKTFKMPKTVASCLAAALLAGVHAYTPAAGAEQAYPMRPIRWLVPFGPGGVGDITTRVVAQKMSEAMGQQVIIDNRPSAGGIVAMEVAAKANPDGYTLMGLSNANAISAAMFKSLPYDTVNDFAMVSTLGAFSLVVIVVPDSPVKTLKDLIAQAHATPGKLNIGTVNIGTTQYLSAELFKSMARLDMVTVPYNNTAAVLAALRSNSVQVAFEFLPPAIGQIKAGIVRPLAVTPRTRFALLPDVPTLAESGVPGYEVTSWNGLAVPAKTPRAIIERLNKEVHAAVNSPQTRQRFQELGVEANASTPEGARKFLVSEIAKWNALIDKAAIQRQ
jgi:tripartite-type tricarboxylate transporter receptor subunit TctC